MFSGDQEREALARALVRFAAKEGLALKPQEPPGIEAHGFLRGREALLNVFELDDGSFLPGLSLAVPDLVMPRGLSVVGPSEPDDEALVLGDPAFDGRFTLAVHDDDAEDHRVLNVLTAGAYGYFHRPKRPAETRVARALASDAPLRARLSALANSWSFALTDGELTLAWYHADASPEEIEEAVDVGLALASAVAAASEGPLPAGVALPPAPHQDAWRQLAPIALVALTIVVAIVVAERGC